jgi:hypothetical protein
MKIEKKALHAALLFSLYDFCVPGIWRIGSVR